MITTPSGLQYEDELVGSGPEAKPGQDVRVHYTGWLYDNGVTGAKFDSSRDPLELVEHAIGPNHQYPDGLVLFLGTMFAPTQDRFRPGQGFTHAVGDLVAISTPRLGTLVNRVNTSDRIAPWAYGSVALMRDLARRGLL